MSATLEIIAAAASQEAGSFSALAPSKYVPVHRRSSSLRSDDSAPSSEDETSWTRVGRRGRTPGPSADSGLECESPPAPPRTARR
jgi:hypothetical protein